MKLTLSGQTAVNLSFAVNEMDIGYNYREFFSRKIQGLNFTSPFKCDGFGEHENLKIRLLCEFKENVNLKNRLEFAKVLAQAIYYVKKFELTGVKLPSTILLGDRDECCVLHTNDIIEYLVMTFDWEIAPSSVEKNNLELIKMISENEKINPFIFSVNQLDDVIKKVVDLTDNVKRLIPITNHNITNVFDYFQKHILGKTNLNTNELANLFVQILINPFENYLHPVNKVSAIVTKNFKQIPVRNRKGYQSFFEHFKSEYTPREKETLTSIVDRLVEDTTRRKQGEFFTPTIWVDMAHEYISSVFGEDWKEKYVVWDPAWGTGNLTRDYKFKELYVSTLNQSDIDTANQMGYNPEAVKFQFDFLNDPDEKLPLGLKEAFERGKEIIVLMNPPYVESSDKSGEIEKTTVSIEMSKYGFQRESKQMFNQFIYRLIKTSKKIHFCQFTNSSLFTYPSYCNFRNFFLENKSYVKGFVIDASEFADVKSWPLTFSIIKNNLDNFLVYNEFIFDILENKYYQISNKGTKTFYTVEKQNKMTEWVKENTVNPKNNPLPVFSSVLKTKKGLKNFGDSLGYCYYTANRVEYNQQFVSVFSTPFSVSRGFFISKENFYKTSVGFASRMVITNNVWNANDEYLKPKINNNDYKIFEIDSIIILLFSNNSNQSSYRNLSHDNKIYNIKNEFFWMSKDEMLDLANDNNYTELYSDARTSPNRYVYNLLFGEERIYDKLSPDAKLVLDKATELVRKSIPMRQIMADDQNHLDSWDAGYAQLKLVWKEHYSEEFKEFRQLYKNLEDRMRPLVYELGFLMK